MRWMVEKWKSIQMRLFEPASTALIQVRNVVAVAYIL